MSADLLLGIDSGTSVVKSVVFDLTGVEVAVARRETPVLNPQPGWSEVDMQALWQAAAETIREVVQTVGPERIAAVGISGTACGVWPLDAAGRPVRNAILWNDGRAAEIISGWQADGTYSRIFQVSGNAPFPGYPLSTLRWLHLHEPEALQQTRWLLFHKDWLRYNLTGDIHTDESDVSYFPGDIRTRGHSADLLALAGLEAYREKLAPLIRSEAVAGQVTREASKLTGLRAGTPVVAGAVDVVASALGGGTHRTGQACAILGTSFLNSLVTAEPAFVPVESGVQAVMPGGGWLRSVVNTSGTINIDWLVDQLAGEERAAAEAAGDNVYDRIEAAIAPVPPGSNGIVYLPYLNTAGIVSPFADANARGMFFGLSTTTQRTDLMRAVYEGTALAMRDCFDAIGQPVEEVVLVGGGARSAFWSQMFADATDRRILVTEGTEFGARGAAILAGVGTGVFASFADAIAQTVRPAHVYTPQPAVARVYATIFPLYQHLYRTAREGWALRKQVYG
ncbi:MAG TPA: FGGY-family carbohydrate kinase [Aggregatilineales bacterium]|nr:FGGY-family carbohydrate kinase [Aggregatilineales bacterium]